MHTGSWKMQTLAPSSSVLPTLSGSGSPWFQVGVGGVFTQPWRCKGLDHGVEIPAFTVKAGAPPLNQLPSH